jgi:hypothetical protein
MTKKITDLFGAEHDVPDRPRDEPTEAWVEGWFLSMAGGVETDNPYPVDDYRHNEWQDGYDAAERD